jgi:IMP dehydrogenase/GMP reductase
VSVNAPLVLSVAATAAESKQAIWIQASHGIRMSGIQLWLKTGLARALAVLYVKNLSVN